MAKKKLIVERDVLEAKKKGISKLPVPPDRLVTPAARDAAKQYGIEFVTERAQQDVPQHSPVQKYQHQVRKIAIGADHGGFSLKSTIVQHLQGKGYDVHDCGTFSADAVDYPDPALAVAERVHAGTADLGIIIDGAGIGSAIVANKVPNVRAACCNDLFTAANSREHNGANVITLGGRVIGDALALKIIDVWLTTDFGGGRHQKRLNKVIAIDEKYRR